MPEFVNRNSDDGRAAKRGPARLGKRRGHGEGSIYCRADGRWAGPVEDPGGQSKHPRKYVYGKTRAEVRKKIDLARHGGVMASGLEHPP